MQGIKKERKKIHRMVVEENFHEKWGSEKVGLNICIISSIKEDNMN